MFICVINRKVLTFTLQKIQI